MNPAETQRGLDYLLLCLVCDLRVFADSPVWTAGMESACWSHRGLISKSNFLSRSPVSLADNQLLPHVLSNQFRCKHLWWKWWVALFNRKGKIDRTVDHQWSTEDMVIEVENEDDNDDDRGWMKINCWWASVWGKGFAVFDCCCWFCLEKAARWPMRPCYVTVRLLLRECGSLDKQKVLLRYTGLRYNTTHSYLIILRNNRFWHVFGTLY